jgi:hypothetical protein
MYLWQRGERHRSDNLWTRASERTPCCFESRRTN